MAYNGFTNWQTWNFHVWYGDYCHSMAEDGCEITEDFLRDLIDDEIPDNGLVGDFINDAIDQINFYELCELYNFDNEDNDNV